MAPAAGRHGPGTAPPCPLLSGIARSHRPLARVWPSLCPLSCTARACCTGGLRRLFETHKHRHPGYAEKRLYYNPATADTEEYIRHADIPALQPLWMEDKGSPRK